MMRHEITKEYSYGQTFFSFELTSWKNFIQLLKYPKLADTPKF